MRYDRDVRPLITLRESNIKKQGSKALTCIMTLIYIAQPLIIAGKPDEIEHNTSLGVVVDNHITEMQNQIYIPLSRQFPERTVPGTININVYQKGNNDISNIVITRPSLPDTK